MDELIYVIGLLVTIIAYLAHSRTGWVGSLRALIGGLGIWRRN
ncbi:hypothetical protein [Vulcanisaeta sp. JCM 16159]